ncbi:hypothetical protein [Micromonospora chokoriensis]|uniref:hypothetical protein n=1 Tax=Micromonospora chokoriensis TaxID=356851 RepID=UPI0012FC4D83|nr:hypothetical protein [Micromonospora chokoriensis]
MSTEEAYDMRTALTLARVTYYADDVDPGLNVELVAWPDRDYPTRPDVAVSLGCPGSP